MYLYIFEDGTINKSTTPPTEMDKQAVADGILDIIVTNIIPLQHDGGHWVSIPDCIVTNSWHEKG